MDFLGTVMNSNARTTPAEKQLRPILFDEGIQVLSSFELNQMASLTYNDVTCDGIFEFIEKICRNPLDHTPLTIQKSLIVTKHMLIYGSEKTVNHVYAIQECIKCLLDFNTVLMTQKQGGAMSFFQTLQGGGVDKGGPVREAASAVVQLLANINELRRLRLEGASQDSLVPVGDDKVAFYTDEVRFHVLKRRMEAQQKIRIQSNLKKSEGGYGAGYASKDGKTVVGAAHGIEEMIKMAKIQSNKFSDDGTKPVKSKEEIILEELQQQAAAEKAAQEAAKAPTVDDLLGSFDPAPTTTTPDLLDFGASSSSGGIQQTGDLLGGGLGMPVTSTPAPPSDPFGLTSTYNARTPSMSNNLLDMASQQHDPFAVIPTNNGMASTTMSNTMNMNVNGNANNASMMPHMMPNSSMQTPTTSLDNTGMMNGLSSQMTSMSLGGAPAPQKTQVMSSNEDRFSALDALAETASSATITAMDAKKAEDRILGMTSTGPVNPPTTMNPGHDPYSMQGMASPSMPMGMPPPLPDNMVAPGSGQVAKAYGNSISDNNDDNPWVMGGSTGMGLGDPVGPVPSAPPPPPPPDF